MMPLRLLVFRSLRQHLLATVVTALSIALAGGLLMSVWVIKDQSRATFTSVDSGFDAVLGARGSKLQLVLNAIFHLEASPGNISASDYEQIRQHRAVKAAIPIAVGDNLRGYRIVGTVPELFTDVEIRPDETFAFAEGRVFEVGTDAREAVLGSFAAERLGLGVGDTFSPYHGLTYNEASRHDVTYTVVGVLEPANLPADKVVWISLSGVQNMPGHDPRAATDVSAVLIQLRSPAAGFMLDMMYNRQGNRLTFAYPVGAIVADLFSKIGWFDRVLALVAQLVALVSAVGILAAIYNSLSSRRRDFAILRALGAHRRLLFGAIVTEAAAVGALGMLASFGVYAAIAGTVATIVRTQTGVVLDVFTFHPVLAWTPPAMIALAALCGLLPAWKAYRTDVASHLAPTS